ncbi:MAG: ester cyclase [Ktedonobacteraceae bacterium]|nr:ester cyclase [Ktedonobacteraceae bacterium]
MSVEHNKTIARRFFEEFLVEGKSDVHDSSFAPHLAYHVYGVSTHTHQSITAIVQDFHQGITNRSVTIDDLFGEGDRVALRFSLTGTHSGQYRQHAPTNQPVNIEGVLLLRFEADQVAEMWVYYEGFDYDVSPK